jgi:hypothetical protein
MTKYYAISYEAIYDSGDREYRSYQGIFYHKRMLTHKGLRTVLNRQLKLSEQAAKVLNIQWLTHQILYG